MRQVSLRASAVSRAHQDGPLHAVTISLVVAFEAAGRLPEEVALPRPGLATRHAAHVPRCVCRSDAHGKTTSARLAAGEAQDVQTK